MDKGLRVSISICPHYGLDKDVIVQFS
jgi:hypothetical protein